MARIQAVSKIILLLLNLTVCQFILSQSTNQQQFQVAYDSAYTFLRSDNPKHSLRYFDFLFEHIKNHPQNENAFKTYEQYALYFFMEGDFTRSAENLLKALDYANKLSDKTFYWDTKNNLAVIYSKLDELEKAKSIYLEIYNNTADDAESESHIATLSNLGSVYQNLNELDSSKFYLRRAIKLSKKNGFNDMVAADLNFLAKNHILSKNYDSAIIITNELKSFFWEDLSPRQRDDAIFNRAQAYFYLKKLNLAQKDLDETFQLMKVTKKDPALIERLEFQSELYEAKKAYKEALETRKYVTKLRDSFDMAVRSAKVLEIEEKYESEKKEKENLKLKQEAAVKDLKLVKKNNLILIGSLLFTLIIVSLVAYQLKKFKDKNSALRQSIAKRVKLERELEIVRENIAKDFHDDLGNKLARISTLSDLMISTSHKRDENDLLEALKRINEDADVLYKGTRDFMFSLKPNSDYLEELVTYIIDFGEEFFDSFNIDFLSQKTIKFDHRLPHYWNRQIIMIFKEAMTNVVKHSKAKRVIFKAEQKNKEINISLFDDGIGFDPQQLTRTNGLVNMKSRAHKLGANLSYHSSEKGTSIVFSAKIN